MRRPPIMALALALLLVSAPSVAAQDFAGTFTVPNDVGGVMTLTLQPAGGQSVTGSLSSNGVTFQLQGAVEDGTLVGSMEGPEGPMFFEADRWENEIWLTLYGSDTNGQPDYENFTEIDLVAQGTGGQAPAVSPNGAAPGGGGVLGGDPSAGGGVLAGGGAVDPFVGTFSDGNVTLELQGGGGQYQGRVSVSGTVYGVSASGGPSGLQGTIQTPQQAFPMSVSPTSGGVIVVEGGAQYNLMRQDGAQAGAFAQPGGAGQAGAVQPGVAQPGTAGAAGGQGAGRSSSGRQLAPGFTDDHPMVAEWRTFLSGKKVTRTSSYSSGLSGGYSARTDAYLCSNGSFAIRDESSVSVDVGGAFGNSGGVDSGQGSWYLITNGQVVGLILEYNTGQVEEYRMDYQGNETYANGERVYVTPAEICY